MDKLYQSEFIDGANCSTCVVRVTNKRGGDAGHGSFINIEIKAGVSLDIETRLAKTLDDSTEITFKGDLEIETAYKIAKEIVNLYEAANSNESHIKDIFGA